MAKFTHKGEIHEIKTGERASDITALRGLVNEQIPKEASGFLIQDHPEQPAKIIIQKSTGKTHTVGYFAASEVIEALNKFYT